MGYIIKIDYRERGLIKKINILKNEYGYNDIEIRVLNLDLGDIIISKEDNGIEKELLIIERKTLNDLSSSLKDGRYKEQSFRLTNTNIHNHNILYLIEGNIPYWNNKFTNIKKETLYVSMFSLNYYKGFSVINTNNLSETTEYILRITNKLSKSPKYLGYYDNSNNNISNKTYTDVINRVKKSNIKPENIGEIILSQIPGVSKITSKLIMNNFNSLNDLLLNLRDNKDCLNNITYKTSNNINKKISSTCINNIKEYLLYEKTPTIKINIE